MIAAGPDSVGVIEVVFLLCIGLCLWKKLWIALSVLGGVVLAANLLHFGLRMPVEAGFVAFGGVLLLFPVMVYLNLERREKEGRQRTIRRTRRHTGRET